MRNHVLTRRDKWFRRRVKRVQFNMRLVPSHLTQKEKRAVLHINTNTLEVSYSSYQFKRLENMTWFHMKALCVSSEFCLNVGIGNLYSILKIGHIIPLFYLFSYNLYCIGIKTRIEMSWKNFLQLSTLFCYICLCYDKKPNSR